jgi:hypothetical protein
MERMMQKKEKRSVKKLFRFTSSEWSQIEKKCDLIKITPTQYFQHLAISGKTVTNDCLKEKQRYLMQITKKPIDINTIVRKLCNGSSLDYLALNIPLKIERKLDNEWLI